MSIRRQVSAGLGTNVPTEIRDRLKGCEVKKRQHWARFALATMACLLLVTMVALAGCGGSDAGTTPSNSSGSTGSSSVSTTEDSTLKTYSNGEYSYSFQYPETWTLQEGSTADVSAGGTAVANVGLYDPDGTVAQDTYIDMAQVSVYKLNVTVDGSMMADIKTEVQNVLSSLESQAGEIKTMEALAETTVNGMSGFKITYSLTKENAPVVSTLYFLFSGNMEYQVTVQASKENWDAKKLIFDALIGSFKPTA
jgi:hypothetical protein